ncbi:Kazal-type serine protease inhibitor family protein [Patescibacteria group bacterium]|nr:Kazal-type serine protease inhibitor family protein [Patescibacteria group bacterium]MBU1721207.1 Kazal-type serine protease inhibitor family protein [Patescibacteria group bacterium]MBU1901085.1 Kazal-type serine protease inhibitor family protein [Patescibacteria group bacterium]
MKRYALFFLIAILPFFLSGCGEEPLIQEETTPIENNEQLVKLTPEQELYLACTEAGYSVAIRFDYKENTQVIYCVLQEQPEWLCPAKQLIAEQCGEKPEHLDDQYLTMVTEDILEESPRFCEPIATPICGTDGRTYTNACFATQQNIGISKEGPCTTQTPMTPPNTPPPPITSGGSAITAYAIIPPEGPYTTVVTESTQVQSAPSWLDIPIQMLRDEDTTYQVVIYRCIVKNTTYYYEDKDSSFGLDTLYTPDGEVICYPNNDFDRSCPLDFRNNDKPGCTPIWKRF